MNLVRSWLRSRRLRPALADRARRNRERARRQLLDLYVAAPTYREAREILELMMACR